MAASPNQSADLFDAPVPTRSAPSGLGQSPEAVLASHFGFAGFRNLQKEIIDEALAGRSVIGILPTGSGKSICFQVPALILPGVTLVVSPLISLMKDQVDGLVERDIDALAITSHDTAEESRDKLARFQSGQARLVYVAPERLANEAFLSACMRLCQPGAPGISLLAVDEAHCVSQWGHDFRPEYRQIASFRGRIGDPPLMALTATAQPRVQAELAGGLGIKGAKLYKAPIDRPALWIGVEHCGSQAERRQRIVRLVSGLEEGSAIVYATSRADTESLAEDLHRVMQGRVSAYHAGLSPEARTAVQNRFMAGFLKVVVATNAFGMG